MVKNIKRDKNDIFNFPILGFIFKNKIFQKIIQSLVLALFIYAIYYGFENPTKENIFTKNVFWGLFWSFFMVLSLSSFGRIFCGICPHGFLGKYLNKFGLKKTMPKLLQNRYIGIGLLIFAWWAVYYVFPGVLKIPFATALMFLLLTLFAFIMFFLYKDMSYCKYLCPIGNVTKAYQKVSATKLGTYNNACSSCTTFDCAKACSYNLKPFSFDKKNSMDDCSLCMDCSRACESINFKVIAPSSRLYKKTKTSSSDIWVYILIVAAITFTMSFHHALGRSNLAESLPWALNAKYISQFISVKYLDLVGLFAFLYSLVSVILVSFIGMYLSSKVLKQSFKSTFSSLGYAYAPLFLIAGLAHLLQAFMTKTYANIGNGFIQGFSLNIEKFENLASRGDSWLMIFNIFPYLAIIMAFVILYKRVNLFKAKKLQKILAFVFASSLIVFYLWLNLYKIYVFKEYGLKKRNHHTHLTHKRN